MMRKISAVVIDTYEDKTLARLAIEKTIECGKIGKVYTLSDAPFFDGAEFIQIPKINSIHDYEKWVLGDLLDVVNEDFLVVQWDGFVVNPQNWNDDWLQFDYIGAPHDFGEGLVVGNGGFSFRTLKIMNALRRLQNNEKLMRNDPEDIYISKSILKLKKYGIEIAPLEVAQKFSYQEGTTDRQTPFAFHSPWNFPFFFREESLLPITSLIINRINNFGVLTNYLAQLRDKNMMQLFRGSLEAINRRPELIQIIDASLSGGDKYGPYFRHIISQK